MGYTQIRLRHDTAAAWVAANPVLAAGEPGLEIDTLKIKCGDGGTRWNDLAYLRGTAGGEGGPEGVDWGQITGSPSSNALLVQALENRQARTEKGKAGGYAPLDGEKRLPEEHLPKTLEKSANKGKPGGYAGLGADGIVPDGNLPQDLEKKANRGRPDGYAGLDADGKLPEALMPGGLEQVKNRGIPGGYAPLGADGKIPKEYLPDYTPGPGPDPGTGGTAFPRGTILFWPGALSEIPSGFALCDGTQGTPNLLDRFIVCVPNATTNPGANGGTHEQRLTVNQLPIHKHTLTEVAHKHTVAAHKHTVAAHYHSEGSHTHSFNAHTHSMSHTHSMNFTSGTSSPAFEFNHDHGTIASGEAMFLPRATGAGTIRSSQVAISSSSGQHVLTAANPVYQVSSGRTAKTTLSTSLSHSHAVNGSTGSSSYSETGSGGGGSTGYASGGSTGSAGGGETGIAGGGDTGLASTGVTMAETGNSAAFDNRPAYYTLAPIMKL